jgi:hypothetical protein
MIHLTVELIAMDDGAITVAIDGIIVHLTHLGREDWQILYQDNISNRTSYYDVESHKDGLSRLVAALLDYSDARKEKDMG